MPSPGPGSPLGLPGTLAGVWRRVPTGPQHQLTSLLFPLRAVSRAGRASLTHVETPACQAGCVHAAPSDGHVLMTPRA